MLKRYRVRVVKDGKGRLKLSSAFLTQLETAFQRFQRGKKERTSLYKTHEHHKARPSSRKLIEGIVPLPFYRIMIGRFALPFARRNRAISIPNELVRRMHIKEGFVNVTLDDQGESIAVPTAYNKPKRPGGLVANTASTSYSIGFRPTDTLDPDGLFIKCKEFVTKKYALQRVTLRGNPEFHSMYFIRLVFAAKVKGGEPNYYVVSTRIYNVYENGNPSLTVAIEEMRRLFYDTMVKLEDYSEYEMFYLVGVSYYTHDIYRRREQFIMRRAPQPKRSATGSFYA